MVGIPNAFLIRDAGQIASLEGVMAMKSFKTIACGLAGNNCRLHGCHAAGAPRRPRRAISRAITALGPMARTKAAGLAIGSLSSQPAAALTCQRTAPLFPWGSLVAPTRFGIFTGPNTTTAVEVKRPLTAGGLLSTNILNVGQVLSFDMMNGGINTGGSQGLSLFNFSSNYVFQLLFRSGSNTWQISDSAGSTASTPRFPTPAPLPFRRNSKLTSPTAYQLTAYMSTNTSSPYIYTGTISNAVGGTQIAIARFYSFDIGSGNNLRFNNLQVSCPDANAFTQQPQSETVPAGANASLISSNSGDIATYQWQYSPDNGSTWNNVTAGSGTNSLIFMTNNVPSSLNGYQYRNIASDGCGNIATSSVATLTVLSGAGITTQPQSTSVCSGSTATLSVTASGTSPGYSWSKHTNGGWGSKWVVASSGGGNTYVGTATNNDNGGGVCVGFGAGGDINSLNGTFTNAWAMYGPDHFREPWFSQHPGRGPRCFASIWTTAALIPESTTGSRC